VGGALGRGYVMVHVDGMVSIAGAPARASMFDVEAGSALVIADKAIVRSKLVVIEVRISNIGVIGVWSYRSGIVRR
jgi:hypothetical protein